MDHRTPAPQTVPTFPGYINTLPADAAPRVIQSAFVRTDEASKHAILELECYAGTSPEEQAEGKRAALVAVLRFLGPEWSGEIRRGEQGRQERQRERGRKGGRG